MLLRSKKGRKRGVSDLKRRRPFFLALSFSLSISSVRFDTIPMPCSPQIGHTIHARGAVLLALLLLLLMLLMLMRLLLIRRARTRRRCSPIVLPLPPLAGAVRLIDHALQQARRDPDAVLGGRALPRRGRAGRGGSHRVLMGGEREREREGRRKKQSEQKNSLTFRF